MDIMTMNELKVLMDRHPGWCLSLYMPTHRAGRDTEQDPIRFSNLLRQAEERLLAKGMRSPEVRELLRPAQELAGEPGFWRHQSDGLAVFLASDVFRSYRVPLPLEELVVIANRFHFKPLLPLFANDGHFYILALSQNQVRLLEGTRHTVDEVDVESLPQSLVDALGYERFEKQLQFHTGTSAGSGGRTAMFHGHDADDDAKARVVRWLHKVDDELPGVLTGGQSPVVLAGVDYLFPLYREANTYPHLVEEGIPGNPEELSPAELHARAWPLVEPIFSAAEDEAIGEYNRFKGTGRTTADVQEAVLAAHQGRVDTLFVPVGVQVWGVADPSTNSVHVHQDPEAGDEDLLDLAAIESILKGGTVYAVEPEKVPDQAILAAVFRY